MKLWHRYPVFRAFLALSAGILLANFTSTSFYLFLVLFVTSLIAATWLGFQKRFFFEFSRRWWFGAAIVTVFFSLGVLISWLYTEKLRPHHLESVPQSEQTYLVQLQENPLEKENSYGARARILSDDEKAVNSKIMLYLQKNSAAQELRYGDRVLLKARLNELSPPKNPHEFDYKNYLNLKAIYYQAYADSSSWQLVSRGHGLAIIAVSKKLRSQLLEIIDKWEISQAKKAITNALLLGYRYDIEDDQLRAYASAGAMHVLAVSGLHVGIVYLMAFYALYFLEKIKHGKVIRMAILILLLWFYACLTGLSASVVRAATMFTFVAVGTSFKRSTSVYNTILGSAMLLLLIKPTYLFEVGFQLSYAAVFGIVWLQPKIESLWQPPGWLLRQVWAITTVSIAAQLATFPLGLYYFHQFPSLFLLSNLMVIPIVTLLMYIGLASLLISLSGFIPGVLIKVYDFLLGLMNAGVNWVEQQAFLLIDAIHITRFELVLLYFMIITGFLWMFYGGYRRLAAVLTTVIVFSGSQLWEQLQLNSEQKMVIYSVRNHAAIGVYGPHKSLFISDSILLNDEDALTFHAKHHWWARDVKNPTKAGFDSDIENGIVIKDKNLLAFADQGYFLYSQKPEICPAVKTWIVTDDLNPPHKINNLPEKVVLTSKLSYYNSQDWIDWCEENELSYWNTSEQGAWVKNAEPANNLIAGFIN